MCDFCPENAARPSSPCLRRYRSGDRNAVRDLFVRVNRALAPADMREACEAYIRMSLDEEIGRIPEYTIARADVASGFSQTATSFWAAFGLERVGASVLEIRRMYVGAVHGRRGFATLMLHCAERIGRREGVEGRVEHAGTPAGSHDALSQSRIRPHPGRTRRKPDEQDGRSRHPQVSF